MKKTTTNKLAKKLAKYGALTVAVAGLTDASGQIIYTDVDPDFGGGTTDSYGLDLNNDGTIDFNINGGGGAGFLFLEPAGASNSALGSGSATFAYPFALTNSAVISAGQASWFNNGFSSSSFASLNYSSCNFGNYCNITDGYIGLRFDAGGGAIHYAWVRLDTNPDSSFTVKEYGYSSVPDTPILAGQQTLSTQDVASTDEIRIVALNKSIGMYNLPAQTSYRLFDVTGKKVLQGTTNQSIHTIEATTFANGIFILEVQDVNSDATIRKKIIL